MEKNNKLIFPTDEKNSRKKFWIKKSTVLGFCHNFLSLHFNEDKDLLFFSKAESFDPNTMVILNLLMCVATQLSSF